MQTIRRLSLLIATAVLLSACSAVPNMDAGSAGCQNARGIGRDVPLANGGTNMAVAPELHGLTPAEAKDRAESLGHTVVFNTGGSCWCVPPPGGKVTESWYGQHGALWLWVDGAPTPAGDPPFAGWGC
jgi:hypothetical protein